MDDNKSMMTELYDIKRQNSDWEIKLEENNDFLDDRVNSKLEESGVNKLGITVIPNAMAQDSTNDVAINKITIKTDLKPIYLNGNGLIFEKTGPKTNSLKTRRSPSNHEYDGIKNVEQFVERRKINGITWYYCLWQNCSYGSNKSNHLVYVCFATS